MKGLYGIHIHTAPDSVPRCVTDLAMARRALRAGMAGIVIKNHDLPTGARAAQIEERLKEEGHDLTVRGGGTVLNRTLGFTNHRAVEADFRKDHLFRLCHILYRKRHLRDCSI